MSCILRGAARSRDLAVGQTGELAHVVDEHRRVVAVVQYSLTELGRQGGKALGDLPHPGLAVGVETGPGADRVAMAPLEQTQRWLVQTEAVAVLEQRVDPGEQTGVQCDGVAVRGELRCELGGDRIALGVGVGTGEVEEDACRPRQRLPAAFECLDGVDEGRFGAGAGDLLHLTQVLGHRLFEGGHEVVVGERREVGQTVQMRTTGQNRVRGHGPMVLRCLTFGPDSLRPYLPLGLSLDASDDSAATNASCGTSTRPIVFIRFLPSFCFSSSLRLRLMSPP